jgi:hypothetical protein
LQELRATTGRESLVEMFLSFVNADGQKGPAIEAVTAAVEQEHA